LPVTRCSCTPAGRGSSSSRTHCSPRSRSSPRTEPMLSLARYVVGCAAVLGVVGALGGGAGRVRRALLPEWRGAVARLAEATIALATLFAVAQVLGAVHLFSRWAVLAGELLAGAALFVAGARFTPPTRATGGRPHDGAVTSVRTGRSRWEVAAAVAAIAVVAVQWVSHTAYAFGRGMTHPDTLWYHQPFAATFVQQHA